jgi:4-aminobutyrate aminotransferase/(S)-3-amino-2-methylpropionate transaminase
MHDESGHALPSLRTDVPGPASLGMASRLEQVECPAFTHRRSERARLLGADPAALAPLVLERGVGANLFDVDGNRFVDLVAGFGALLLGHSPKPVLNAMMAQEERLLMGLGDVYPASAKLPLLERLAKLSSGRRLVGLLGQSGADAVTAALKTAVLATGKPGVVAFEGSYHGLSYAPLAASSLRASYREPFAAQLSPHVRFVPYPRSAADADRALAEARAHLAAGDVGAVLIEPVLGRGGVVVPPPGFLRALFDDARAHGALAIADEIWTGLGRSGALLRSEADGAEADVIVLGKGLGGGMPISACLAPEPVMRAWRSPGLEVVHTSTHVGSPLACAAAVATLDVLSFRGLVTSSATRGEAFRAALAERLAGLALDVRGVGLMVGIELEGSAQALTVLRVMLEQGFLVLTGGARGEVVTLTPPLVVHDTQLEAATEALGRALEQAPRGDS